MATIRRTSGRWCKDPLRENLSEDPQLLARFHTEARVVASLRYPNFVCVFDFDTIDGRASITGSHNFSRRADYFTDEKLGILYDGELAAQYLVEFNRIYRAAAERPDGEDG